MRPKLWHVLVFSLAFAVFAITMAPASLLVRPQPGVLTYASAMGTVWNGRLEDVQLGPYGARELSWRVRAIDLLRGQLVLDAIADGGHLNGSARLIAGLDGSRRIVVPEAQASGAAISGVAVEGVTLVRDLDIAFARGACAEARGYVESDVLTRAGPALGWVGPPVSGGAFCEEGIAVIAVSGASATGETMSGRLSLHPGGAGEWRVEVGPATNDAEQLQPRGQILASSGEFAWQP